MTCGGLGSLNSALNGNQFIIFYYSSLGWDLGHNGKLVTVIVVVRGTFYIEFVAPPID